MYALFKMNFGCETYLLKMNSRNRKLLCKLRTSNMPLPVETGRWIGVRREDRLCPLCNNDVGDEYHYLFLCENPSIQTHRRKFIPNYYTIHPNMSKFQGLLTICNVNRLRGLCCFLLALERILKAI